jgi:hypothetical protein
VCSREPARLSENFWWRRWLDHVLYQKTCLAEDVDVPAQWPVGEGQADPGRHFVDRNVVPQVGANPPIRLARALVVDPSAPGRLQKRVDEEQQEPSSPCEHPGDFMDGRLERVYVFERQTHNHRVEGPVRARELFRPRS